MSAQGVPPRPLPGEFIGVLSAGAEAARLARLLDVTIAHTDATSAAAWQRRASPGFALGWRGEVQSLVPPAAGAVVALAGGLPAGSGSAAPPPHDCDALAAALTLAEQRVGAFSAVAWDAATGRLHLLRDRAGLQPLYIARLSDGVARAVAFASRVPPLLALLGVRATELDDAGIAAHALEDWRYVTRTVYRHIHAVPPGCYLSLAGADGDERCTRWWPGPLVRSPIKRWADGVAAVRHAVQVAVRDHVQGATRVAIDVSGGIDSSSVFAAAYHLRDEKRGALPEFVASTLAFPGLDCDESHHVDAVLARCPSPLIRRRSSAVDIAALQREAAYVGLPPHALVSMHAALNHDIHCAGVAIRVSGEGGDELFALGARQALALAWRAADGSISAVARRIAVRALRQPLRAFGALRGRREADGWMDTVRAQFSPDGLARMDTALQTPEAIAVPPISTGLPTADLLLRRFACGWYAQSMAATLSAHAAQGVELRCPLLDHRLLETCATLPPEWLDGMTTINRKLLREAFAAALPAEITSRQDKSEFSAAFASAHDLLPNNASLRQALRHLGTGYMPAPGVALDGACGLGALELAVWQSSRGSVCDPA